MLFYFNDMIINILICQFLPWSSVIILSCSKTTYKKASPIVDDDCISISNIMVVKNHDSIWELRNEEEEHLYLLSKL